MLLGLAEAQLAKALAGEAISTLVEEVAGHMTRDERPEKKAVGIIVNRYMDSY